MSLVKSIKSTVFILFFIVCAIPAFPYNLELTISEIQYSRGGKLLIAIYNSAESNLSSDNVYADMDVPVNDQSTISVVFKDLPEGEYSVAVLQDTDGNRDMTKNAFGIPKEGFGFTRITKVPMGEPRFSKIAVKVDGDTNASVKMLYMNKQK